MSTKRRTTILKDLIQRQDLTIGVMQQIVNPEVTESIVESGADFVIVDLEHTGKTIDSAFGCITAAYAFDVPVLVRVYEKEQHLIEQALDAGAQGVVVPTVETVEECEMIVRSAKFAPVGERGWCPILPAMRWVEGEGQEYIANANRNTFVSVLIETPLGIANLPEMLKVEGIDAFLLGPGDYSIRVGKTIWDPEVSDVMVEAMRLIAEAGKLSMPVALSSNIAEYYGSGAKVVQLGFNDSMAITQRMAAETASMREAVSSARTPQHV